MNNKAIITYEISDLYQEELGNSEKFEIQVLVTPETEIYRDSPYAGEHFKISDLKTIEYVQERVMINLDPSTIEDEIPTASKVDIGWLDENF